MSLCLCGVFCFPLATALKLATGCWLLATLPTGVSLGNSYTQLPHRTADKTGYSEANSREFRHFFYSMARKSTSTLPDEDFDAVAEPRASSRSYDDSPLDARILALDDEEESPFLRGQKRVPVRR